MTNFVIRIEGINFDQTLTNTDDISTIRGSSLTLEVGVRKMGAWLDVPHRELYAGGSQVAFLIENGDEAQVQNGAAKLRARLREPRAHPFGKPTDKDDPPVAHMRFAVEVAGVQPGPDCVGRALERAQAGIRRQQLRTPSVAAPDPYVLEPGTDLKEARCRVLKEARCRVDRNRPLSPGESARMYVRDGQFPAFGHDRKIGTNGKTKCISLSQRSKDLREYGRSARRGLYADILGADAARLDDFSFAQSFEDIVAQPPDGLPLSTQGKIGVLYFDGVGFGSILAKHVAGGNPGDFSDDVRRLFSEVIGDLLGTWLDSKGSADEGRYLVQLWDPQEQSRRSHLRLETLMLGGEDYCVVVPAWLAWATALRVLGTVADFKQNIDDPLMLRCGALICDARTPIRGARGLAKALCDDPAFKAPGGNAVQFHVIESVEVPDASLAAQRQALYGVGDGAAYRFDLDTLRKADQNIAELKRDLSHAQVYKMIRRIERDGNDPLEVIGDGLARSGSSRLGGTDALLRRLPGPVDAGPLFRLKLLAMLWDYVHPFPEAGK